MSSFPDNMRPRAEAIAAAIMSDKPSDGLSCWATARFAELFTAQIAQGLKPEEAAMRAVDALIVLASCAGRRVDIEDAHLLREFVRYKFGSEADRQAVDRAGAEASFD